ncbi:MAG: replication-associated recombination protein A [Phycisphaerales bacterium]|nr:replication-associated recombination protein A [Phycisphaerales bacterium]
MHLWSAEVQRRVDAAQPLAARLRPRSLDEVIGQAHLTGPDGILRKLIGSGHLGSLILWGPPGTGKTTLADVLAREGGRPCTTANAATIGVKQIREVLDTSRRRLADGGPATVLFLDEIHRFSKSQQDVLLGDVERGVVSLIGATTENPWYTVNDALISRATVLQLNRLDAAAVAVLLDRSIERGEVPSGTVLSAEAREVIADRCEGDARRALAALELACHLHAGDGAIPAATAEQAIGARGRRFDRQGDQHYDLASALIKCIRASDVDASIHWLAVLLEAGEDPRFICRRLAILASEDIGLAAPQALQLADAAWSVVERIGLPEAELTLSELVVYLASCPKSNAAATAIWNARSAIRDLPGVEVPLHLRSGQTRGAREFGYGEGYVYAHDDPEAAAAMNNINPGSEPPTYYVPSDHGFEATIKARLEEGRP